MVWWDEAAGKWTGTDVPDFVDDQAPRLPARLVQASARHGRASAATDPFIMEADGTVPAVRAHAG